MPTNARRWRSIWRKTPDRKARSPPRGLLSKPARTVIGWELPGRHRERRHRSAGGRLLRNLTKHPEHRTQVALRLAHGVAEGFAIEARLLARKNGVASFFFAPIIILCGDLTTIIVGGEVLLMEIICTNPRCRQTFTAPANVDRCPWCLSEIKRPSAERRAEFGHWSLIEPVWLPLNRTWDESGKKFVRQFRAIP
jgi:hypothetical protein